MAGFGPLAFAAPWVLTALAVLPVLWWLLRAVPPAPRRLRFPAVRLLFGLEQREETPHRMPWWLLALRLLIAALVVLGLAHPLVNPGESFSGGGPLLLVVDDGWGAAAEWPQRRQRMNALLDQAEREGKPVVVLATAPTSLGEPPRATTLLRPAEARRVVQALAPKPWPSDRDAAQKALDDVALEGAVNVVWVSDGLDKAGGQGPSPGAGLAAALQRRGALTIEEPAPEALPRMLRAPQSEPAGLRLAVSRPISADDAPGTKASAVVVATGEDGRILARETLDFAPDALTAERVVALPGELRNRITRLAIEGEETAGAVILLDERFRRRPVGLVTGDTAEVDQPLLGDRYYLERALKPYAELRAGSIETLLSRALSVLVLADIGNLTRAEADVIAAWVEKGGVLVRFAGPRLAEGNDRLLPVRLRRGGRTLGGVMSWAKPARLAPFDDASPFAGLAIPGDVVVDRQVLAEPAPDLPDKTWARLDDGTPLVTAVAEGEGWVVLVHTSANTAWSNLALSGLYVSMLRRVVALSQGVAGVGGASVSLRPVQVMDGFGRLTAPTAAVAAITGVFGDAVIGPRNPPGYYGDGGLRRALNLGGAIPSPVALGPLPAGVQRTGLTGDRQVDLRPWVLVAAFVLLLADSLIALALRGLLGGWRGGGRRGRPVAVALAFGLVAGAALAPSPAAAQRIDEAAALKATLKTHLAYVVTGDPEVDRISEAGLRGLTATLIRRTSVEPGPPVGLDPARDELAFYPVIYWPMTADQPAISDATRERLNGYLRHGGLILFDTRDQQLGGISGVGPGTRKLRELVGGLDLPPLEPVPPNHVLTKAFYLLNAFPGRWADGQLWVQETDTLVNDGVSPVVIGANDFAGAWAMDDFGRPLLPVVPGGERQREMALRFGINLVMYALTGNYKADQVHVPAILERLGQ